MKEPCTHLHGVRMNDTTQVPLSGICCPRAHLMCVCPDWDAECAGQAKICELQLVISTIHQDVLGFHVAVQDAS